MGQVKMVMSADEAQVVRAMQRVIDKQREMGEQANDANREQKGALNDILNDMDSMPQKLAGMAAGYLSVQAVLGAITAELQEHKRLREEAVAAVKDETLARAKLAQIAASPAAMAEMGQRADELFATGRFESMQDALGTTFDLYSAGFQSDFEAVKQSALIDNAQALLSGASKVRMNFGEAGGSFQSIVSRSLAAAAPAPGTGAGDILMGMSQAAQAAQLAGVTPDELFAAIGLAAQKAPDPAQAATQVRSLLFSLSEQIGKGNIQQGSLSDMLSQIQSMGLSGDQLQTFLGRKEAISAMVSLTGGGGQEFQQTLANIQSASGGSALQNAIDIAMGDPRVAAGDVARQAGAAAQVSLVQDKGSMASLADALAKLQAAEDIRGNAGLLTVRQANRATYRMLRGDEAFVRMMLAHAANVQAGLVADHGGALQGSEEYLQGVENVRRIYQQMANASEAQERAAGNAPRTYSPQNRDTPMEEAK